mmetsp:Transcript_11894/g.17743  ORF Transcript_11894/g.17743 Transcript_11894/m.17743 type:complete len:511 (+) Transcript_11894:62-1594(+)|eukprot:CAMPEP_0171457272 /NCGR_PEP_ID=MMETSP0945-20130129/3417_1 /TAXON_ID=109269 /ORGANISM="Vaucheria litorea, Strain CCMP2940" /LENGTH=510 /DNA_ID=CAMNT_0011982847 /DNA_START=40 /DNA_END=1572 /DNA_ORIENTATION=-
MRFFVFLLLNLLSPSLSFLPRYSTVIRGAKLSAINDIDAWMRENEKESKLPSLDEIKQSKKKLEGIAPLISQSEGDRRLEQNSALLNWLAENGVWIYDKSDWGQSPHSLAVAIDTIDENENERAGRGMVANKEIKEGDELFSIPLELLMTKERSEQVFGKEIITPEMNEYIAIALLLIHEKSKNDSFWKPYIDVLPTIEEVAPTWSWSEEDLSYMEGSPVIRATESMSLKLKREFSDLQKSLLLPRKDIFPEENFTFQNFQWAFSILFSRAIRLTSLKSGQAVALIPYADLINHNPFANSYVDARNEGWLTQNEVVSVYSDRSYKKMEQIYISYGPKSNSDLLLLYGFALDRNPFNSVEITVSLEQNDPLFGEKNDFLKRAGMPLTMSFPLYNDRYPDEAFQYMRLICFEKSDRDALGAIEDVEFADKVSNQNELQVLSLIIEACERALERYPTTEEEDTALMIDRGMYSLLSKNQRMAVKHRRQEKRILKKTIAAVMKQKERLSPSFAK